jgi:hypothetical protein
LDKAKPGTGNTRGLNLAAIKRTTVQVTRLPLYPELHIVGHDLLFSAWTYRGLVYTLYILFNFAHINCTYNILLTMDDRRTQTMTNDRPDLSSEGAPDIINTETV